MKQSPPSNWLSLTACLAFISLVSFSVTEAGAASDELRQMLHARSVGELNANESLLASLQDAHESCRFELRRHLLPRDCFRELTVRAESFARSRVESMSDASALNTICLENAKASRSRVDLEESLSALPSECQSAARERLADFDYVDSAERPELSVLRATGANLEMSAMTTIKTVR